MIHAATSGWPALWKETAGITLLVLIPALYATAQTPDTVQIYTRATHKPVQEVMEDVEFAISERNFRVTSQLHVGHGIRERDKIAFPDYEVILFCNLGLARKMLELDPGYINYCPGRITVRGAGDTTHIAAPLLPEHPAQDAELATLVRDTNAQLRAIVDFGTENWDRRKP